MDERTMSIFNDSLERCTRDKRFMPSFYETFIGSSDEVAAKFARTNLKRQGRILRRSLYIVMMAAQGEKGALQEMGRLGGIHDRRHLDIGPHLYALWLQALILTVRQHEPACTGVTEAAWREVMQRGIDLLLDHY